MSTSKEEKKSKSASVTEAPRQEPKTMAQKLEDRVERAKSVALNKEIAAFARQKNLTGPWRVSRRPRRRAG